MITRGKKPLAKIIALNSRSKNRVSGRLKGKIHIAPFDRMLVAQAQVENLPIVSNAKVFDRISVRRLW